MPSYAKRQLQNKIPAFKHRTIGWHLQLALGEKRAITYRRYIGYSARNSPIQTLADLCAQPLCATYQQDPRVKLHYSLLSLYQQRLRFYFIRELGLSLKLEEYPAFSLYSANYPSRAKPARTTRQFVAGRTLIWHLYKALGKRGYLRVRLAWKALHPNQSWAKYCSTYSGSYYRFDLNNRFPRQLSKKWHAYGKQLLGDNYGRPISTQQVSTNQETKP